MDIITITQARDHCKTDAVDDVMLIVYANAAEKVCAQLANRALFVTQAALTTAIDTVPTTMTAAFTAHTNAMTAAASLDENNRLFAEDKAAAALRSARVAASNIVHGIVADNDIIAAILLTTGHFYRNREEVVVGQAGRPEQVPMAAERIMRWHRRVGTL